MEKRKIEITKASVSKINKDVNGIDITYSVEGESKPRILYISKILVEDAIRTAKPQCSDLAFLNEYIKGAIYEISTIMRNEVDK